MNTIEMLSLLKRAYKKFRMEKGIDDPESPGEVTVAEGFEIFGYIVQEFRKELGGDFEYAFILETLEFLGEEVAEKMGEELEDDN